jgi:hypothetical protein
VIPQDGRGNALFAIDSATGQISLTAAGAAFIDFESGARSYTLNIKASDGANDSRVRTITIQLTDVSDAIAKSRASTATQLNGDAPQPAPGAGRLPAVPVRFGGRDFPLQITPFTLPDAPSDIFKSLAVEYDGLDVQLERSVHFISASYRDVLTQAAPNAFRVVVATDTGDIALRVFRGIPDQELTGTRAISVQVPLDAFVHTQEDAVVQLNARMAHGGPLPSWLVFDASTGKFIGMVPPGGPAELDIVVEARDRDGRRAEAMFRIKINATAGGRAGLSQQLQTAMRQPGSHIHLR